MLEGIVPLCSPRKTNLRVTLDQRPQHPAAIALNSLELLQRVRIRPYPGVGGHGNGVVVVRGGDSGGFEMWRVQRKSPRSENEQRE